MLDNIVTRLESDVADMAYKLCQLEEEVAQLNAYVNELKEKERDNA
jgi:hypothetical protein